MKNCPDCRSANADDAKFCQACGASFSNSDLKLKEKKKKPGCFKILLYVIGIIIALSALTMIFNGATEGIRNLNPAYRTQVAETEAFLAPTKTAAALTQAVISATEEKEKAIRLETQNTEKTIIAKTKQSQKETENAEKTIAAETKAVIKQTEVQSKLLTSTAQVFAKETEAQQKTVSAAQTQTATFLPSSTPTITRTPTITPTLTVTPLPWQATGTANAELIAFKKGYEAIYWKELDTYPENYEGQKVQVTGRASQINSSTEMNAFYGGTYEMFYVISDEPFVGIYENNSFTVYGTVYGKHCGSNALGGTVCLTVIDADLIEKQ